MLRRRLGVHVASDFEVGDELVVVTKGWPNSPGIAVRRGRWPRKNSWLVRFPQARRWGVKGAWLPAYALWHKEDFERASNRT